MHRIASRPSGRVRAAITRLVASRRRSDVGLGLVEVIVSISLLGIFAITFAPILYTNLDISTRQTTIAYAAQQAATYIDDARANGGKTCDALTAYAADTNNITTTTDGRNVPVKVSGTITGGCSPAPTGPSTATLTVTACEPSSGSAASSACNVPTDRRLTTVSTQILVVP